MREFTLNFNVALALVVRPSIYFLGQTTEKLMKKGRKSYDLCTPKAFKSVN